MALCTPWAAFSDLCGPAAEKVDEATFNRFIMPVSEYLYAKTGRKFKGQCPRVVRPCAIRHRPSVFPDSWGWRAGWFSFPASTISGFPWGYCGCFGGDPLAGSCGCGHVPEVRLGTTWIDSITEVKIDGVVLDPSAYRVDEHRLLVRVDGAQWPRTQNMVAPASALNTFEVSYVAGRPIPSGGVIAAAALAGEWGLGCVNDPACRLPRRAQSASRTGVNVQFRDVFSGKLTGIPEVDAFIDAENPKGIQRRAIVVNPDTLAAVRRMG